MKEHDVYFEKMFKEYESILKMKSSVQRFALK